MPPKTKKKPAAGGAKTPRPPPKSASKKVSSAASTNPMTHSPASVSRQNHEQPVQQQQSSVPLQNTPEHSRNNRPRNSPPIAPTPRQLLAFSQSKQPTVEPSANEEEEEQAFNGGEHEEEEEAGGVGQQYSEDEEGDDEDEEASEGLYMTLNALLTGAGRDDYLQRLSPHIGEGTWFDRDHKIVPKVSEIIQDRFEGPYYSWRATPQHVRDQWFIDLAHRYTWDPVISPLVRQNFNKIAKSRLKGMVSYVRRTGKKPHWIKNKLWETMVAFWATPYAIQKSATASASRNSDRGGLGPHVHVSGPKSHARIQRDMEEEEGREVSLGEVFIKAHTRKDGTLCDQKAKKVKMTYDQKMEATLSQLEASAGSDGASNTPVLTVEQKNQLFLESTFVDDRGTPYGIGNLAEVYGKGKKSGALITTSPVILELKEQLDEANAKIKEANHQNMLMFKYLNERDPNLPMWLQSQAQASAPPPPQTEDPPLVSQSNANGQS